MKNKIKIEALDLDHYQIKYKRGGAEVDIFGSGEIEMILYALIDMHDIDQFNDALQNVIKDLERDHG